MEPQNFIDIPQNWFIHAKEDLIGTNSEDIFKSWRIRVLLHEEFFGMRKDNGLMSSRQLAYLCWYGLLAPTTHNTIPQRFHLLPKEQAIDILIDRKYVLPASDSEGRQALISIGAVIENISRAAGTYGYDTDIRLSKSHRSAFKPFQQGEDRFSTVAKLQLKERDYFTELDILSDIIARKVIRAEFEQIPFTDKTKQGIHEYLTKQHKHVEAIFIDKSDSTLQSNLANLQKFAMSTVIQSEKFAIELGNYLLPNDEAESSRGMRGREFGLDEIRARKLHLGLKGKLPLIPSDVSVFAGGERAMMLNNAAIIILTTKDDSIESRLLAGQAYQDLALSFYREGYTHSMHAALTEVVIANYLLRVSLGTKRRPMVLFRVGKPKDSKVWKRLHSSRPNLSEVLV